jgi:hypothetical protein
MEQFIEFLFFTIAIITMLFLPALFELKKPKDNGPRKIVGFEISSFSKNENKSGVVVKQSLNRNRPIAILDSIPNLEA